jgi:hypothetical protein
MDDQKKMSSSIILNEDEDIIGIELFFYHPIPVADFSIERILAGKCGGCGERNKKAG